MTWFRRKRPRRSPPVHLVRLEVFESVLENIHDAVAHTDLETGGKLVGHLYRDGESFRYSIEDYLDAGPGVSRSRGHIIPDGHYQEALFRLLEAFDADIEHLGSWHSHHCNGLRELSAGDVTGYVETVNHPDFNVDFFLAILVVDSRRSDSSIRFFVFQRGAGSFDEIPFHEISVVPRVSRFDRLLRVSAETALREPDTSPLLATREAQSPVLVSRSPLLVFSDDGVAIRAVFPEAQPVRSRRSGALAWRWSTRIGERHLDVLWSYVKDRPDRVVLEISHQGSRLSKSLLERPSDGVWHLELLVLNRLAASRARLADDYQDGI